MLKVRRIRSEIAENASGIDMSNRAFVEIATLSRSCLRILLMLAAVLLAGCPGPAKQPPAPLGYGYPDAEKELDHFLCYTIDDKASDPFDFGKTHAGAKVLFQDQFYRDTFTPVPIVHRDLLCNPALKTHGRNKYENYVHEDAHLVCYGISQVKGKLVRITNQFETGGADPGDLKSQFLCLPSGKTENVEQPPAQPRAEDLSHFLCYKDTKPYSIKNTGAKIADQFIKKKAQFNLNERELLCNPTAKRVQTPREPDKDFGKQHADAHLVCYTVKPEVEELPMAFKARIKNQFEDAVITTDKAKYLCVPSVKKELGHG
jgi:hypothetical protein